MYNLQTCMIKMLFYPSILWIYASYNPFSITRKHRYMHQSLASVWCEVQEPTLRSGEYFSNDIGVVTVGDKTTTMKVYQRFLLRGGHCFIYIWPK